MAKIVHFEIPADDIDRAKTFYIQLFGWAIENCPGSDYFLIQTGEQEDENALKGGMMLRQQPQQPIINYVEIPSVAEYMEKVGALGGKVVVPKTPVPGMGYFAVCHDTENNTFGLWETDPEAGLFADQAEVFVGLMAAMIAADETYSVDEMRLVWNEIQEMEMFAGRDYNELEAKVLGYFNKTSSELTPFDDQQIEQIIMSAVQMLEPPVKKQAFRTAVRIAHADKNLEGYRVEVDPKEKAIIDRLRQAFEIDSTTEAEVLEELKPKFY